MEIMTAKELSILMTKSLKFIYTNATELGGIKIGGSWVFTREGLENAIQRKGQMAGKGDIQRPPAHESAQNKKGCNRLGTHNPKGTQKEREKLAERAGFTHFL